MIAAQGRGWQKIEGDLASFDEIWAARLILKDATYQLDLSFLFAYLSFYRTWKLLVFWRV